MRPIHQFDSRFMRVMELAHSLTTEALAKGLSPTNPIRLEVFGTIQLSASQVDAPVRSFIVSYAKPVPSKYDVEMWVNPINHRVFKSIPQERVWRLAMSKVEVFTADVPLIVPAESGADIEEAGQPVAALTDLAAIDTTDLRNKTRCYVEQEQAVYLFEASSIDDENQPTILQPYVGPGRWRKLDNPLGL